MGVMECERKGCEQILCRRMVCDNRYICESCYEDLLEYKKTWPSTMTKDKVRQLIVAFMESECAPIPLDEDGIDEEFNRLVS